MVTKNIIFGPHETRLLFELEKENLRSFTFHHAKEILSIPDQSIANVIYRLKKKNRITGIEKGKYLLIPARSGIEGHWSEDVFLVVDSLLDEYYVGFLNAMYYWNLTEQIPLQVLVAATKRKKPIKYNSQQIRFITLNTKRFFGFTQIKSNDHSFKISSLEKTIVDALLHPQHCGRMPEVAKAIWGARDDANWSQVLKFMRKIKVSSVVRRLGYILDELDFQKEVKETLVRDFQGFRWLDPSSQKEVKSYSKEWGLILNLSSEELLSWRGFS